MGMNEFPTLKLPPKDYSMEDAFFDKREKGSFANRLCTVMKEYSESNKASYSYKESDGIREKKEKICSAVNRHYNDMRCRIDQEMQAYLLEHDGNVDSWDDSTDDLISKAEDCLFVFDYFGEDYKILHSGEAKRKSSRLVYRNQYQFPGTEPYNSAERRRRVLETDVRKAREAGDGGFVRLLCLAGMIYLMVGMLAILGDLLFHLGSVTIDLLYEKNSTLGILVSIPYTVYSLIVGIFGEFGKMEIFFIVILLGACLFGFLYLLDYFKTCSKNAKALKKAKKALDSLIKSDEYRQTVSENDRLRRQNEELAEQWHRAWYAWVCSIKKSAAEATDNDV